MDVFQTLVTGCQIIYKFLDAYSSASEQSRSLAARLNWDLRVLRQFTEYYENRIQPNTSNLSKEDAEILEYSTAYLFGLSTKISAIAERIQSKNKIQRGLNKALWWHRGEEVRELEEELFEWTTRLDLRLVGLPTELKTVIKLEDGQSSSPMPNFTASVNIQSLRKVTEKASQALNNSIFQAEVDDTVKNSVPCNTGRFCVVNSEGSQYLVERRLHDFVIESHSWKELKSGLIRLASALHCLDGTTVSLLHCNYVFEDSRDPRQLNFSLVNSLPFGVDDARPPLTLRDLISRTQGKVRLPPMHSLTERFSVALGLATAVFFLHSVGFLHHAITSHSILMLERSLTPPKKRFPHSLGAPFLVGFETVKEFHTASDEKPHPDPDVVYQHPDRLLPTGRPKYSDMHDVYSLGMVLLELAIWKPLERYQSALTGPSRLESLADFLKLVDASMGRRYRKVVEWCLGLETGDRVDSLRFLQQVIEPLEEMVSALK